MNVYFNLIKTLKINKVSKLIFRTRHENFKGIKLMIYHPKFSRLYHRHQFCFKRSLHLIKSPLKLIYLINIVNRFSYKLFLF